MATIEEGQFCHDDTHCSSEQYCYNVSGRCVDYTQCSRYNRQENKKRSRHPSQCGLCLPNYTTEELGTGEMALLCKKAELYQNVSAGRLNNGIIIYSTIGVVLLLAAIALFAILLKRRRSKGRDNNIEECGDLCLVEPSAPPIESRPFIDCGERLPFNNNKNVKDKNKLVCAAAYKAPSWVRSNPDYESNSNDDATIALDQLHSSMELPPADNNANTWVPQQLPLTIVNGNITEFGVEQVSTNAVQRNNPSSSTATEENGNNNSNDSTSESNNAQDGRERGRGSNILIAQTISMNVNVLNSDY
ncbi:uncharacterized protein LOC143148081 [Ptiloglossa arizonensis]|uniref:uncharacterized protein LOC143148081 n=1 Tax=Ptiloglossa arizonensis TaxID=3350558 RepID=UPI003FA09544